MTAVLNYVILVLIGLCALAAVIFLVMGIRSRALTSREAYGVGQQEARRSMQINIARGVAFMFVGLILLGVYGLSFRPAQATPEPTKVPPATSPVAETATPRPSATATAPALVSTPRPINPSPTTPPESSTPTVTPEPDEQPVEPTSSPNTAIVTSEVGVWLRAVPGTEGAQLEWVLNGTVLTVLPGLETADDFAWQQVRTPDGNEGWVATEYIEYVAQ